MKPAFWNFSLLDSASKKQHLHLNKLRRSPLEIFTGIDKEIKATDFHTFGCSIFIFCNKNQSGAIGTPNWEPWDRTVV